MTSIGSYAFYGCIALATITIPNSVTCIAEYAFYGCSSLTSITIPNSVTNIHEYAFRGCSSLTSITIPNSVTSIGGSAFYQCSSLANITIPNSVTSISDYAFWGCSSLTSITIGNSVTSIGYFAFYGCTSLTSITIPNSVTSIGNGVFSGCTSLTSITIGNSVTSIGDSAFENCYSLTSIIIPNSVTTIGSSAFYGCSSLSSISIPNSVTSIGNFAFYGCSSLTSITIPNSVTYIGERAFSRCDQILTVTSEITEPFGCAGRFSQNTYRNGTLYIPAGTKELYVRFDGWREFLKIVEMDDSGELLYLRLQDGAHGKMRLAVKRGENYTFKIEPEEGWKVNSVTYNDVNMTGLLNSENQMTTPAITGNAVLSVVYEQTGSGVRQLELDALKVFSLSGGRVQIEGAPAGMQVLVYTLDGALVSKCTTASTPTTLHLPEENIYLIKVGAKTLKMSVR